MQNEEYFAGATLVNEGIEFDIPFFGRKKTYNIKPLKPGTIVRISMLITKLQPIEDSENIISEFLAKGKNLKIIAKIIATSIINRNVFKMWKFRFYMWLLLDHVENIEYLYSYFLIVQRQMHPVFFYRIMSLTPAMNFLMKKARENQESNKEVEKPFGEQSDSSRKPSDSAMKK